MRRGGSIIYRISEERPSGCLVFYHKITIFPPLEAVSLRPTTTCGVTLQGSQILDVLVVSTGDLARRPAAIPSKLHRSFALRLHAEYPTLKYLLSQLNFNARRSQVLFRAHSLGQGFIVEFSWKHGRRYGSLVYAKNQNERCGYKRFSRGAPNMTLQHSELPLLALGT